MEAGRKRGLPTESGPPTYVRRQGFGGGSADLKPEGTVRYVGLLSLLATLAVGITVGVRLLQLGLRGRRSPELAVGLGLLCLTALGLPISAVGRLPMLVGTALGSFVLGLGLVITGLGIWLLYVFTWRVFRPHALAIRALIVSLAVGIGLVIGGFLKADGQGETLAEILPHTRPWACAIVVLVVGAFGWTGAESLHYHRLQRRRLALGLADPVVANRFLLWAVGGLATAFLCLAIVGYLLAGMVVLRDPLPLFTIAIACAVMSASWCLAFFPPRSYLDFVRERAGAQA